MGAPDLIEPIVGWRMWNISEGRVTRRFPRTPYRLYSPFWKEPWQALEPFESVCMVKDMSVPVPRRGHPAPDSGCTCGVYALRELVPFEYRYAEHGDVVEGEVFLWGRVVVCEKGWRAQFAYPKSLNLIVASSAGEESRWQEIATDLGAYGVPVDFKFAG